PLVVARVAMDAHPDDAVRVEMRGERAKALHREVARGLRGLGMYGELLREPAPFADAVGVARVEEAVADRDPDRPVPRAVQLVEPVGLEEGQDRQLWWRLAVDAHRGPDGRELDEIRGPRVAFSEEAHVDDHVRAEHLRFLLHARERERSRAVVGARERLEL